MVGPLVLTLTRACPLRCSYCPTVRGGGPSLGPAQVRRAIRLFPRPTIKLFGGEPLLVPEAVEAALDEALRQPQVRWVQLSTNGLPLDADWLGRWGAHPKLVLTLSLDGPGPVHRVHRASPPGVEDSYDHVIALLSTILLLPRVVVTQVLSPATVAQGAESFRHLRRLGFWRFNLLPAYLQAWPTESLAALRRAFRDIAGQVAGVWEAGGRLHLRNLTTWAPTPFFNTGVVVEPDGSVHATNQMLGGVGEAAPVGSLDEPPTAEALEEGVRLAASRMESALSSEVRAGTMAADAELSRFVRGLLPRWAAHRGLR